MKIQFNQNIHWSIPLDLGNGSRKGLFSIIISCGVRKHLKLIPMKCAFSALDKSSVVVSVDFWNKKLIPTLHKYRSFDNSCVIATTESAAVLTLRL